MYLYMYLENHLNLIFNFPNLKYVNNMIIKVCNQK